MSATAAHTHIRAAGPGDAPGIGWLLAAAFQQGDLGPWLIPAPEERTHRYLPYFTILAEHALTYGQVDVLLDIAVAIWYRHDDQPQPVIRDYPQRLSAAVGPHCPRFYALDAAMHTHHPQTPPHDYLAYLAVRPQWQGRGIGSRLLEHRHRQLDTDPMPAYLEATGLRNQALYLRHGYQVRPSYLVGQGGPLLYPMWRPAGPVNGHPTRQLGGAS